MATLTKGKTFTNGETVTPQKLHELVDLGTVSGIVNADIAANAAITDSKLAQITTVGKVANSATSATNANTANAIVARDGSGNFSAGTISANLSGNATTATSAATATTLQTARTINGVSFNGSANITVTADPNAHTHNDLYYTETEMNALLAGKQASGSYAPATGIAPSAITGTAVITTDSRLSDARTPSDESVTDAKISSTAAIADSKLATISTAGKVSNSATTATNANTANAIVARDGSGNFSAGTISANLSGNAATATTAASCSGNAATATTLQTARTINGVSFNGSADITVTANPSVPQGAAKAWVNADMTTLNNTAGYLGQPWTTSKVAGDATHTITTSTAHGLKSGNYVNCEAGGGTYKMLGQINVLNSTQFEIESISTSGTFSIPVSLVRSGTISSAYNVSSVFRTDDLNLGNVYVNFDTALGTSNYASFATAEDETLTTPAPYMAVCSRNEKTVNYQKIVTFTNSTQPPALENIKLSYIAFSN